MMPSPRVGAGQGAVMDWARILAYVTGTVDQELLARNEYLAAENRILKAQLKGRLKLSDAERGALGEIGHRLGRKVLADVATVARPDTILGWYRKLVARKFDGSKARRGPGRPRIKREVEQLIIRMASENRDWGYDRIAGALANLGYEISDQTVGNVLRRHGLPPAPERKRTTTWAAFIRTHLALLAGTDFFTAEVLTLRGLVTYYVLFFIHLESRRVDIAGITVHPMSAWMKQIARNATMEDCGALRDCRYLLHDRDTKFTRSFRAIIASGRVEPLALPARSPNLNAYAERWVRSVKEECLSKVILFGERSLRRALSELCRPFPCRAESPGEGQRPAVSSGDGSAARGACAVPRAIGWASALLSSRGGVMARRPVQFFDHTGSLLSAPSSRRPWAAPRRSPRRRCRCTGTAARAAELGHLDEALVGLVLQQHVADHLVARDAVRLGLVVDLLLDQRRAHVAGADGVAGDAVLGGLERRHLGEAEHAVLGRDIGRLVGRGDQGVRRGDVDDAAPAASARMPGSTSLVAWKAEERLIARMASHFSSGNSSIGATCWMPALFTMMSTRAEHVDGLAHHAARSPWACSCRPANRRSWRWCCCASSERVFSICSASPKPFSTTLAPARAKASAMPSPMPLVEPVTMAVLP